MARVRQALSGSNLPRPASLPAVSRIAQNGHNPFHILVSTIISLRTQDRVTDWASQQLLQKAPDPQHLARLDQAEIAKTIYPAGFYRTKAANLKAIANVLLQQYAGKVPQTLEQLLALPGVGRKTANLVLGLAFGIPAICVDTHVHRISNRLGWVRSRNPEETETQLCQIVPKRFWIEVNDLLVRFGQSVCAPISPHCSVCPLGERCPRVGVTTHR